jgi:hypothetical protein
VAVAAVVSVVVAAAAVVVVAMQVGGCSFRKPLSSSSFEFTRLRALGWIAHSPHARQRVMNTPNAAT